MYCVVLARGVGRGEPVRAVGELAVRAQVPSVVSRGGHHAPGPAEAAGHRGPGHRRAEHTRSRDGASGHGQPSRSVSRPVTNLNPSESIIKIILDDFSTAVFFCENPPQWRCATTIIHKFILFTCSNIYER